LRAENQFMPDGLRYSADVAARGDMKSEIHALLDAGVTGFFSDFPDLAVQARDEWWSRR
jgi:glycerophosphoryl diester phosphodiesterase